MRRRVVRAILAVGMAANLALVGAVARPAGGTAAAGKPRYLVVIVLDGGKPNYLTVSGTPTIQSLMKSGTVYTNAWDGILESETPSTHATIATGSEPRQHGIISFGWATNGRVTNIFNPAVVRRGVMEQVVKSAGAQTIAGLMRRQDPSAQVVALSGYKYYAADALGGPDANAIMYFGGRNGGYGPVAIPRHVPPAKVLDGPSLTVRNGKKLKLGQDNHLAMRLASRVVRLMRPRALLINLPDTDWPLGHVRGGGLDWKDLTVLMRGFDRDLRTLMHNYQHAGILKRTTFVLTADHGMTPLYNKIPSGLISDAVGRAGSGITWQTYHTGSYLWLKDPSRARQAADNIMALGNPYIQAVYYKVQGPKGMTYVADAGNQPYRVKGVEAAAQYLLGTFTGPSAPDLAIQAKEGSAFVAGGQLNWKGDHGGFNWQAQNVPLVIAGPGVQAGRVSNYPARLEDIAPTVLTMMGFSATGMQGSPLADAFVSAPAWAAQRQTVLGKQLWPLVMALKGESQAELPPRR